MSKLNEVMRSIDEFPNKPGTSPNSSKPETIATESPEASQNANMDDEIDFSEEPSRKRTKKLIKACFRTSKKPNSPW